MTPAQLICRRAFAEALPPQQKVAFISAKEAQQASGPGGMPVAPGAMDPTGGMPGAPAPMDPTGGMPPSSGGMPPMDPAAAGGASGGMPPIPPMDPAAAGSMPPMDMSALGAPPAEPPAAPPTGSGNGVTEEDANVVDKITQRTLDTVRQTLEMVGKSKKPVEGGQDTGQPAAAPPAGPVTGLPGDMSAFAPGGAGGTKTAAEVITRLLKKADTFMTSVLPQSSVKTTSPKTLTTKNPKKFTS